MGCTASSIDKAERVLVCKERKRLMKQLVKFRGEFADAQMAYLRALKNTGVTLRQFTESDSLELENTTYGLALPPSPPPPLPPSPPPPPPFSPDLRKPNGDHKKEISQEEIVEIDGVDSCTPSPPPVPSSSWNFWDPFDSLLPHRENNETVEQVEEENWAETHSEFGDEEHEQELVHNVGVNPLPGKQQSAELIDDNSSMTSWNAKDTVGMPIVEKRNKKTLEGIVKELDDYFLKASAGEKEVAVFMDVIKGDTALPQNLKENKRKRSNSAKVFSALSWSWSSKSLQLARDVAECSSSEPCRPGAHCITLEKLYTAEQKLYKELREEEITKLDHERKSLLLQKQEEENYDWTKTEKTRLSVESLESEITRLQHSISMTCSSVLKLIDEELYPQLVALTSGLMHIWRAMYECHQVQTHLSQQLNHLTDCQSMDLTTEYHRQATAQLQTEVTCWYNSFCKLIISQKEYVRNLCKWIQLSECLAEDHQQSGCSSAVRKICEEWQLVLERLPDKVASEAIKSFLSAIQSIIQQQAEEYNLLKKSDKLERKLERELLSLAEMERKLEAGIASEDTNSSLSPKHPLSVKRVKTEALKKRADIEKANYLNSVQVTRTMTLNNLKTSLPNVFQALMRFSCASAQAFEAIYSPVKPDICDASQDCDQSRDASQSSN